MLLGALSRGLDCVRAHLYQRPWALPGPSSLVLPKPTSLPPQRGTPTLGAGGQESQRYQGPWLSQHVSSPPRGLWGSAHTIYFLARPRREWWQPQAVTCLASLGCYLKEPESPVSGLLFCAASQPPEPARCTHSPRPLRQPLTQPATVHSLAAPALG